MKAHLINTHLLVPRSRSSAEVKVKYKGYISQKIAISGAFAFHKHILFPLIDFYFFDNNFKTTKAINFKLQTLIAHIVDKCSTQES